MNEPRDNTGTLARNEDKAKPGANPNWADYKGIVRVEGRDYWLSGWAKEGKHGKFMSLALKPKAEAPRAGSPAPDPHEAADLPF